MAFILVGCGSEPPTITSVSPERGTAGTVITIEGFDFDEINDVGFETRDTRSFQVAFENSLQSDNGETITFTLPEMFGACSMTQLDADEACPAIGLTPLPGPTKVFVATEAGDSNKLAFTFDAPPD